MRRLTVTLVLVATLTPLTDSSAGRIYFTDPGFGDQVSHVSPAGGEPSPVVAFPAIVDPRALAVDRANGRVFFSSGSTLQRVNLDGTGLTSLGPAGGSVPTDIALDPAAETMYWSVDGAAGIRRATTDGTGATTLVSQGILNALVGVDDRIRADDVSGIALDRAGGRIYWANGRHLNSMPTSGVSGAEDVLHHFELDGPGDLNKIKLDLEAGEVYWTNNSGSLVQRATLAGADQTTLVSRGFGRPAGLAIDLNSRQLYFGDTLGAGGRGQILKADLDGGEATSVYSSFSSLFSPLDLDFGPVAVFAGDTNGDQRVDIIDLNNVRNNFGRVGDGLEGDLDDDQVIGIADLNSVRNNFGAEILQTVPESSAGVLLATGVVASCIGHTATRYRRRRRFAARAA